MNWPNLSAAPRIFRSLDTSRWMLASVIITGDVDCEDMPVLRWRISEAAPYPSDAAKPDIRAAQ